MPRCDECGNTISNLKTHQQGATCRKWQEYNRMSTYSCKVCNEPFERLWHADYHTCSGVKKVNDKIEMLEKTVATLESVLKHLTPHLSVDWSRVSGLSIIADEKTVDITPQTPQTPETLQKEQKDLEVPKIPDVTVGDPEVPDVTVGDLKVVSNDLEKLGSDPELSDSDIAPNESKTLPSYTDFILSYESKDMFQKYPQLKELYSSIKKGIKYSEDGDDNIYLFGSVFGAVYQECYSTETDASMCHVFDEISDVTSSIGKDINRREAFIDGLCNSCENTNIVAFILIGMHLLDTNYPYIPIEKPLINPNWANICSYYTLSYMILPVRNFIREISKAYGYSGQQYYKRSETGWVIEPYLFQSSAELATEMYDRLVRLFRELYFHCYHDNSYRKDWQQHPFLKHYVQVFRNIEFVSQIFDVEHTFRKYVEKIPIVIEESRVDQTLRDKYHLLSTRINYGVPAYETINFFEAIFDDYPYEMSAKYIKKYLENLSQYKDEYPAHVRYRDQVVSEAHSFENI